MFVGEQSAFVEVGFVSSVATEVIGWEEYPRSSEMTLQYQTERLARKNVFEMTEKNNQSEITLFLC